MPVKLSLPGNTAVLRNIVSNELYTHDKEHRRNEEPARSPEEPEPNALFSNHHFHILDEPITTVHPADSDEFQHSHYKKAPTGRVMVNEIQIVNSGLKSMLVIYGF